MVGFHSDIPTFFVGSSSGQGTFGKVGIGTTEPIATLDVNGDLNFKGRLLHNGQEFTNSPWTEGLGSIYYNGGNVGIGTKEPTEKLEVNGTIVSNRIITDNFDSENFVGSYWYKDPDYYNNLTYDGDIVIGDGSPSKDGNDEVIKIRSDNEDWYIGAEEKTTQEESDFFIGNSSNLRGIFHINNNGNVGIGITNPKYGKLQIQQEGDISGDDWATNAHAIMIRGTDQSLHLGADTETETGYIQSIKLGDHSSNLILNPLGGNVGIGTTNPSSKLSVNGKISAEEVIIELNEWEDKVFIKDYRLLSLEEVEYYIAENGHLPKIPSENEMIKNGLETSEMIKLQMQKIEELTLYIIEQNKRINALEESIGRQ